MIDEVKLAFEPGSLVLLNVILGVVMFGVALELRVADFKRVLQTPRAVLAGVVAQLVLLPALTFLLISAAQPPPSVALGMLLVACCPGGNISNFITHLGRGDTGLSITITSVSTAASALTTPLNLAFWGSMRPETAALLRAVDLEPLSMLATIGVLLGAPLALGMTLAARRPRLADRLVKPFKVGSLLFFSAFIVVALAKNFGPFMTFIGHIFVTVLVHNALAFTTGDLAARVARLSQRERRAVTVEVGIQNSGLGLVLIFSFFGGLGGMAIIAAWWGVWHIVAGLSLASLWRWRDRRAVASASPP